ncbi:hypothetical protein HETIRDRAFT_314486 [Heterobasidion irregulare TC 32-1]|uniref:Uncharacterized protein n=1 Tax=Heterobasidion irregulare (strain TC 32-1) TaxID=747525 RepID=W4KGG9_HETIT|nr:uncharacterized protein HETIRDRAFT_314486 [Heterobasidion irregulare TC 32-1]ETW84958.1 hypothetical protein HETIRDRAFT_314486 [Heterobasidion irregulare TC 32-1]
MGGNMRALGKGSLSFDHVLTRLQGGLHKSRETGAELNSLSGAMNEIHETLSGVPPSNLPPYPQSIPPVQPLQPPPPTEPPTGESSAPIPATVVELQSQLQESQVSLASFVDKVCAMEGMLSEHEAVNREVSTLHELMEEEKSEIDSVRGRRRSGTLHAEDHDDGKYGGDDDDAQSITTVTPR